MIRRGRRQLRGAPRSLFRNYTSYRSMKSPASTLEPLEVRIAPALLFATDVNNNLISFDSADPATILSTTPIVGLQANETIQGMDFRPATGQLYVFGVQNPDAGSDTMRLYTLSLETGQLTQLGVPIGGGADGARYGFDFNPAVDRIRVVNTSDQNFRLNPNDGSLAGVDTNLDDPTDDEEVYAVAYDRSFDGTTATTLFGIDFPNDKLVRIGGVDSAPSPNGGVVTPIGSLGFTANDRRGGFDIDATGTAFAALNDGAVNSLYTINLATGAGTLVGTIGDGTKIITGFSVAPQFTVVNPTTVTFFDADGDLVTVKTSRGKLGRDDFSFATKAGGGLQLRLLNLSDDGQEFAKTNITITAVPKAGQGNSFSEVGYINATGVDLGVVRVDGDLGQIDAGDGTTAKTSPGILSLTVQSLGVLGLSTQLPLGGSLTSNIVGPLGKFTVKTDILGASVIVVGGGTPANGTIGPVFIGGSVDAGIIQAEGSIGAVKILGSLLGGSGSGSGQIQSGGDLASLSIVGSLKGGTNTNAGSVTSGGKIGPIVIGQDVIGGSDSRTGSIRAGTSIASLTVRGSVIGGTVADVVQDVESGYVATGGVGPLGNIGPVKVGGSFIGGNGANSGGVIASGSIVSATVGGSVIGGAGIISGTLRADAGIGPVKIAGDLRGGDGTFSGSLFIGVTGSIASVSIGGSLTAASNAFTGIIAVTDIGPVTIGGNFGSFGAAAQARIVAGGDVDPTTAAKALTIKSVTVKGSVINAVILGGFGVVSNVSNPDAQIGAITVNGNWIASSVAASVVSGNGIFGDLGDFAFPDATPADNVVSAIASITIKGAAYGTVGGVDGFGFVAQQIGKVKVGLGTYPLTSGKSNDTTPILVGPTGDLRILEV